MYNRIIKNTVFKANIKTIEENEKNRIFCKHGMEHLLDVARIAYILNLENDIKLPKYIIYSAALLHDIGRAAGGSDHNIKSEPIAKEILTDCGFSNEDIEAILKAVVNHRKHTDEVKNLEDIISKADKLSRQCHSCNAQAQCYWAEERRNNKVILW